jgi:quercetin dioxygenase-like cupin family protein
MVDGGRGVTEVMRRDSQQVVDGPAEYFTGRVTIRGQFARDEPSRVTGAIVTFQPGARTAWHTHPLGQTLIVTDGVGWTRVEDGEIEEFAAGDILLCPRDRRHWHGATPESSMTHVAIQEIMDGTNVTWMEHVTDDEYLIGPTRAS